MPVPLWLLAVGVLLSALPCAYPDQAGDAAAGTLVIAQAIWPDQDLSHASFHLFTDPQMKDRVDVFPSGGPAGAAFLALRPGSYYIMVVVDVNGNGQTDAGDAFGWYGVEDLAPSSRPRPLVVGDEPGQIITIPILVTRTENGGLAPLPHAPRGRGTVIGRLTGARESSCVLLRADPQARSFPAALVNPDGSFEVVAQGGEYQLLAYGRWGQEGDATWQLLAPQVEVRADQTTDLGEVSGPGAPVADPPAVLAGVVTGAQVPEGSAIHVQVCADATMQGEVAVTRAAASGLFVIGVQPATYYLRVIVGPDTVPGPGDMLGFYGVHSLAGEDRPQPVVLGYGTVRADLLIPIVARLAEDGSIVAVPGAQTTPTNAAGD